MIEKGSEFEEEYDAWARGEAHEIGGTILKEPIRRLEPRLPVSVRRSTTVRHCIDLMVEKSIGCVLVVESGELCGIFTERDVLKRVVAAGLDPAVTPVERVMTAKPETLFADDRVVVALNRMMVGGYRHIPITDTRRRPVGILSVRNFVRFIVSLYPEAVLCQPPSQELKHPNQLDGG